jgi:hypothetical protein
LKAEGSKRIVVKRKGFKIGRFKDLPQHDMRGGVEGRRRVLLRLEMPRELGIFVSFRFDSAVGTAAGKKIGLKGVYVAPLSRYSFTVSPS